MATAAIAACGPASDPGANRPGGAVKNTKATPRAGGQAVAAVRTDPKSFSWFTQHDATTLLVTYLTQARLVRVNRATEALEPWLAESWTQDGLRFTVKLRPGLAFSDGTPMTSADVAFSFRAAYEGKGSILADSLKVAGQPLRVATPDPATIVITFPSAFGPGLRLLDNLPILPKHRLEATLANGSFGDAWGLAAPVQTIIGLGPFVLSEYVPAQRLVFTRNPHYFRSDAAGVRLPYLDRLIVQIIPDQNAQVLQLESGQIDLTMDEARPEDYAALKRAADAGRIQLLDLGAGLDPPSFWMNLKPRAFDGDPRAGWIQRDELRQAISLTVDRQLFADTVYYGAAVPVHGPITESSKRWYSADVPRPPHDPARAKTLLAAIGLVDRNNDGTLEDANGTPARFTLLTQKGQTALERGAAVIRDEVKKVGLAVDVVALDGNALVGSFMSGKPYDAVYFLFYQSDTDPALNLDYWMSGGSSRVWNLAQGGAATAWERRLDDVMRRQAASLDEAERTRLFVEGQKIFAEHLPIVHFAAPRIFVAVSTRLHNLTPANPRPQLLWAPDTIAVKPE